MYNSAVKPFFDFIFAFLAFLVLSPLFFLVTLLLLITNRGNPFFFQQRPGKNERIFYIIKFKTMNDKRDHSGRLLTDEKRLTKFGKIVRKTSLDEIPQLLNVIIGNMSLVGPRPLLPEYLPLYNEIQKSRHLVKPGITGWAQINGRNAISWQLKFEYDVWYISNQSFLLDFKILFLTVEKVLKSHGIYQTGELNVEVFKGNE